MPVGVAERFTDEPASVAGQVVLRREPFEELAHERREHGLALLEPRSGRELAPGLVELIEVTNAEEPFTTDGEARDRGLPIPPPDVTPTGDLGWCLALVVNRITAEQRKRCTKPIWPAGVDDAHKGACVSSTRLSNGRS